MTTFYIAGGMTGYPDFNYPAFHTAEKRLKEALPGNIIINPATNHGGRTDLPRPAYLRTAIRQVSYSDTVVVLDGWEKSPGARLEVRIAHELEIPVYTIGCAWGVGGMRPECEIRLNDDGTVEWPTCVNSRATRDIARRNIAGGFTQAKKYATGVILPPDGIMTPEQIKDKAGLLKTTETPNDCPCGGEDGLDCPTEPDVEDWPCGDCGATVPGGLDWCQSCEAAKAKEEDFWGKKVADSDAIRWAEKPLPPEEEAAPLVSVRAATLDEAKRLVCGDRNATYGPPTQDFSRTADLLTALGYRLMVVEGKTAEGVWGSPHALQPSDIAIIMAQLKISRLMHSRTHMDNWTDLAGYSACGAECAKEADE